MDDKLILDNTDFLMRFTVENFELLKRVKTQIDEEIVKLHTHAKEKKASIHVLIDTKTKIQAPKIKNRADFVFYIGTTLMEKHIEGILSRFEFKIETISNQYDLNEKYMKLVTQVEVHARTLYMSIKERGTISIKEMLNVQDLLKEANVPLVSLLKQYNEKVLQLGTSMALLDKVTIESITAEYIDFFLLNENL